MDKEQQIRTILERDLVIGERVTEDKIIEVARVLMKSVDWGDGKDIEPLQGKLMESVDWSDGKDQ